MKATNTVYTGLPTTILDGLSQLAREHDAINLGQGFRCGWPEDVRRLAASGARTSV